MEINIWIKKYEQQIPMMLQQDFPGKLQTIQTYSKEIVTTKTKLDDVTARHYQIQSWIAQINEEIKKLEQVKPQKFKSVMEGKMPTDDSVEHYLKGVFAEWEPIPDWLKKAMEEFKS